MKIDLLKVGWVKEIRHSGTSFEAANLTHKADLSNACEQLPAAASPASHQEQD